MLRFFQLDARSFWNDGGHIGAACRAQLAAHTGSIGDIHPPAVLLRPFILAQRRGESEFALRSLSAALRRRPRRLIYLLGRQLFGHESTALAASVSSRFNPFQVYYSQEAVNDMLLAGWAAASTYFSCLDKTR